LAYIVHVHINVYTYTILNVHTKIYGHINFQPLYAKANKQYIIIM